MLASLNRTIRSSTSHCNGVTDLSYAVNPMNVYIRFDYRFIVCSYHSCIVFRSALGQVVLLLLHIYTFCKLPHLPCCKVFMALAECFMSPVCGDGVMLYVWTAGSKSSSQPSRDQDVFSVTSPPPPRWM
jgi:hypothetical protein